MVSVILSGGSGTRLWPVSRTKLPKQFCDLFEESLFLKTSLRLQALGEVQVCTSQTMKVLTEKCIRDNNLKITDCIYEPFGRNTAPAVALICHNLKINGKEREVVGIFPSDHWVEKAENFSQVMSLAQECALKDQVVTIGIQPDYPATGFGYIETTAESFKKSESWEAFNVKAFHEKPEEKVAQSYIDQGNYHWNSGMFVFKAETMIKAFEKHMPELWSEISNIKKDLSNLTEVYEKITGQSLDYGIMEHIDNQVCIPCDIGWSDLGSWDDVAEIKDQSLVNNKAEMFARESKNCFAYSSLPKAVAVNGLDDLLIINTEDALVVTKKGSSQDIKKLIELVKEKNPDLSDEHVYEYRPWGFYRNIWEEDLFKTKVIGVDPGQQLSLQSHKKRAEIWVITEGEGEVIIDDETIPVKPGSVVKIPLEAKHRMRNTSNKPLKFVEVQQGSYFGEDDIIRYQDDYQRV
ncbi:MAG: mannose-1-phosphate guanylyltransferase/mannose-6-phosphate isomerase [Bdellovibrionales bacterium]|nr:mannose-1-phosphate guanylyltransferase/mannose-6-phosphate isomerase [Bdellovibrionales bacterium]